MSGPGPMAVIVVNYGSHRLLERNLAALSLDEAFRVVIVDNRSSREEAQRVQVLADRFAWEVVLLEENRGFGAGVNAGVRRAWSLDCESVLLLNPDVTLDLATMVALREQVAATPDALVSPLVRTPTRVPRGAPVVDLHDGDVRSRAVRRPGAHRTQQWLPGTCLAAHRELLDRVGEFAEDYFMYWEDIEFSLRCESIGGSVVLRDDLEVCHDAMGTQSRAGGGKSLLYYRYNCRNRLVFAARMLPRRDILRWIAFTPLVSWRILMQGGRRQLLHSPRPLWAAVRGSIEGITLALAALARPRPRRSPTGATA